MAKKKAEPQAAVEPANDPAQNPDAVVTPGEPTLADVFAPQPNVSTDNPEPEPTEPATTAVPPAEPDPNAPATDPKPAEPTPAVEPVVPAQEPAPVDVKEYERMATENAELKQLKETVLGDPKITQMVVDKLSATPQQDPAQAQKPEPVQFQMPKPPQYANMEDLNDPTSETYRWFNSTLTAVAENAKQATQTNMNQQIDQKFQKYEQQKAEVDRQQSLQSAITATQQKVGADAVEWQKFMTWANNPGKDMNDMLGVMYQIYQGGNGNSPQPQTPEPVIQPTNQPITTNNPAPTLPNYSAIGGANTEVVKTENEAFNENFFGAYKKQRKF